MTDIFKLLPEIEANEMLFIDQVIKDLDDDATQEFAIVYRARRRDPQVILLTALIGLIGAAGVHRFLLNHIGLGLLYFFTAGICFIGTIIDVVNYKQLTFEYNRQQALDTLTMMKRR